MNQSYKIMRLLVMFDMPVSSADERREYARFRKFIMKCGFIMVQYSVYTRVCCNESDVDKQVNKIRGYNPKYGDIRILKITDNQYQSMQLIRGDFSAQEKAMVSDDLIVI